METEPSHGQAPRVGGIVDGKYRLEAELGRGGMGIVYAARHTLSQRRVALKLLDPALQPLEEMRRRFVHEAEALGRIEHPNVVSVLDVGASATSSYLVMELLRGEPLRTYLERVKRLGAHEAIMLMLPVISGVEAAHRVGVVHRDLKPENLFVARRDHGERPVLRILDFGVAKLDGGASVSPNRVPPLRHAVGTPRYMSPEQVRGETTDARTDVWGLGSLLFELIAGRPPFDVCGEERLYEAIASQSPPPIDTLVPDVPPRLAREIMRALSLQPGDRHASAYAFGVEIAACVGLRFREPRRPSSPGIPAAPPPDSMAATMPGKRPTPFVASPFSPGLVLALAPALMQPPLPPPTSAARHDATTRNRHSPRASTRAAPTSPQPTSPSPPRGWAAPIALVALAVLLLLLTTAAVLAVR